MARYVAPSIEKTREAVYQALRRAERLPNAHFRMAGDQELDALLRERRKLAHDHLMGALKIAQSALRDYERLDTNLKTVRDPGW